jgi:hypothetical protein
MQSDHDEILVLDTPTSELVPHRFLLDYDEYYRPILLVERETGRQVLGQAIYSLADHTCSGELLSRLAGFVQDWHGHLEQHDLPHSVSHRLAAQFVYLAYWKAICTELRIDHAGNEITVSVRYPKIPELSCTLAQFLDPIEDPLSANELQDWLRFFFETVTEHAAIWQIDLVVDQGVYRAFAPNDLPKAMFTFANNPVKE